jgi:hypothetical protein
MDGALMTATIVYRPLAIVMTLVVLVAVSLTWLKVVQTLENASPAPPRGNAAAIVWNDKVFPTPVALAIWLRARGAEYSDWVAAHPAAAAVLEHRSQQTVSPQTTTSEDPPAKASPRAATSGTSSHMAVVRAVVLVFLLVLALLGAWSAALPGPFRRRYPELAETLLRYREQLAAGAAALVIAVIVGIAIS